jgi:hypothetical protein
MTALLLAWYFLPQPPLLPPWPILWPEAIIVRTC